MPPHPRISAALLLLLVTACSSGSPAPDASDTPTPSVLVNTVAPRQGALPAIVTAYGSVAPSEIGTRTFNEAQPGQVTRLFVAPGSAVKAGQTLATFVTAPTSRSTYEQAVSALAAAQKARASTAQLLAQQLATTDQLVQADKAVSDARTSLAALRAEGAGTPVHTIVAPFAGVVTAVAVAQGDRTAAGATILTVARSGGIVVTVGIDPSQRGAVVVGQAASLKRLSGGGTIEGSVVRVDGALNAVTKMVDVDLSFPAGALLPGEPMQVDIRTGAVTGWVVPHAAVVTAGGSPRIFQVQSGKAKAVPVTIRLSSDAGDVVDGTLSPQLPLIVAGAYQVTDGDAVRSR
ncbi:efflux RND transporter periplasmic adaptor subunit [Sphingomonas sp. A2-49]|uniref:efflux RND transporter periplasmic adaptor subunit n=1 Tax=Sphingomonas sp. A2-49 TaxID=1391375 RepID=UPI0021D1C4AE|nr:efflux RND transporter periplasmic adaptor subunit [Sphingomonas sp. A2-49]MCU6456094.1 efflux RND transporter periplasmic adaptor subunit [Sphingomonas sp. A2-49]